eukprot:6191580-Pleurochrysis_carterae.AAC.3
MRSDTNTSRSTRTRALIVQHIGTRSRTLNDVFRVESHSSTSAQETILLWRPVLVMATAADSPFFCHSCFSTSSGLSAALWAASPALELA